MTRLEPIVGRYGPLDQGFIFDRCEPDPNSGCWLWTRSVDSNGYPKFGVNYRFYSAHRYSYEISVSRVPDGMVVRHKCDTPMCVNPDHLIEGTHMDNMEDHRQRGKPRKRGAQRWMKIPLEIEAQVMALAGSAPKREIARIVGIDRTSVRDIMKRNAQQSAQPSPAVSSSSEGERERIARIIDPWPWMFPDSGAYDYGAKLRIDDALVKADAILAAPAVSGEPVAIPRVWLGKNGDYTPTPNMVEAGQAHMIQAVSEENLVLAFIEMMQQAEIDGLIAPPSTTQQGASNG